MPIQEPFFVPSHRGTNESAEKKEVGIMSKFFLLSILMSYIFHVIFFLKMPPGSMEPVNKGANYNKLNHILLFKMAHNLFSIASRFENHSIYS